MKLRLACALAASSLVVASAISAPALADDYTFSFTGTDVTATPTAPETISGEIFGLGDNGFYTPTSVTTNSPSYTFSPSNGESQFSGGFNVQDGEITSADFFLDSINPGCGSGCSVSLNDNSSANFGSGNLVINGGAASFENASAISAAPEPGTWVLMFAGVAMLGATLRFGRRREGAALAA